MTCSNCSTQNPDGARFCMGCGAALERRCETCGEPVPAEARFCPSCGGGLAGPAAAPAPSAAPRRAEVPAEERRQVTVVFADLSGYTAVAERMDPETVKAMVEGCLRRLGEEVERFGGTVDKYIGDNVMALFGAPVAHEDDAERAVRAALGMQAAMEEINDEAEQAYGVGFALRVGVNTGEVLAGAVGEAYTVTGDTVNVAARLQAAGRPGAVTVGERTVRATRDAVEYTEIGPLVLKGKAEPVPAWEASGLLTAQPVRRSSARREARFVGRDDELAELLATYGRVVRETRPHLVTVVGQAGVGKSRLSRELASALERHEASPSQREGRCLPYGSGIVYWPLTEVLRAECRIADGDDADVAWNKLAGHIGDLLADCPGGAGLRAGRAQGGADRPPAGPRLAAGRRRRRGGQARAGPRELLLGRALGDRGDGDAPAARARLRGHPLGRPRHARPDRVPGAVGAGAADDRLPRARRPARPAPELGRRAPARVVGLPRPAQRRADAQPDLLPAARRRQPGGRAASPRWPSAPAATRCSPRRSSACCSTRERARPASCPTPSRRCWPRAWTRSSRSSAASSSRRP